MDYIKREWKKLGSISLIGVGAFLIIEHIYTYGGIELWDILGHEWAGIVFIIAGILCANKWGGWSEGGLTPLQYAKEKLKYIFKRS